MAFQIVLDGSIGWHYTRTWQVALPYVSVAVWDLKLLSVHVSYFVALKSTDISSSFTRPFAHAVILKGSTLAIWKDVQSTFLHIKCYHTHYCSPLSSATPCHTLTRTVRPITSMWAPRPGLPCGVGLSCLMLWSSSGSRPQPQHPPTQLLHYTGGILMLKPPG